MWDVRFIIFAVLVTAGLPAFAYIDPGSGSAIMSLIIGFFCGAGINGQNVLVQTESRCSPGRPGPPAIQDPEPDKSRED